MVLVLVCRLEFPEAARPNAAPRPAFEVRRVLSVELSSSWQNLTSTATVKLPTRLLFQEQEVPIKEWVRPGDAIRIELGYNQTLVPEFSGFITEVTPGYPVTLACEDAMYQLKRAPVKCSYKSVTLQQLLHDICPKSVKIDALAVDLGAFKAVNVTVAKVLAKLKELYGFVSYFRDGVLFCGKVYHSPQPQAPTGFSFQRDILTDSLDYRQADQMQVVVEATSHQLKGQNLKVTVGDLQAPDAEKRTLQYFNLASEADLKAHALADIRKLKVSGYSGSFTTYGLPAMRHGQVVRLTSSEYPERDGDFFISATAKVFEPGGYRQTITLGSQAALGGLE